MFIIIIQIINIYSFIQIQICIEITCDCLAYNIVIVEVVMILLIEIGIVEHPATVMASYSHALGLINHKIVNVLWILSFYEITETSGIVWVFEFIQIVFFIFNVCSFRELITWMTIVWALASTFWLFAIFTYYISLFFS